MESQGQSHIHPIWKFFANGQFQLAALSVEIFYKKISNLLTSCRNCTLIPRSCSTRLKYLIAFSIASLNIWLPFASQYLCGIKHEIITCCKSLRFISILRFRTPNFPLSLPKAHLITMCAEQRRHPKNCSCDVLPLPGNSFHYIRQQWVCWILKQTNQNKISIRHQNPW